MEQNLLTRRELAEALNVDYSRIRVLEDKGLPGYYMGGKLKRFNLAEVLDWLKAGGMHGSREPQS